MSDKAKEWKEEGGGAEKGSSREGQETVGGNDGK